MKAIYIDCFSGISGNMLVGAFLQAGVPWQYLNTELNKLSIVDEFDIEIMQVDKRGVVACYFDVVGKKLKNDVENEKHKLVGECGNTHHHRGLPEIRCIIEATDYSDSVKKCTLKIFDRLAVAEGKIHGISPEQVHFHEVGAVDSIVDIVSIAICLDYLKVDKIFVSTIATGSGFVDCEHGTMMVPAPATAELLLGFTTSLGLVEAELTTPTGAAVINALAEQVTNIPTEFCTEGIAYGAGSWDLPYPNVLRMYWGEYQEPRQGTAYKGLCIIEANIDDMNPQLFGYIFDKLLRLGALDVWTTAIMMKKNRPANKISILTSYDLKDACIELLFSESTTIGTRIIHVDERIEAEREFIDVDIENFPIRCKVSKRNNVITTLTAEYDDCVRLAKQLGMPLKNVQELAVAKARQSANSL